MSPIIIPGNGYTLAEYRSSVQGKGYDSLSVPVIDRAVNEGRYRVLRDHRWSWLESIASPLVAEAGSEVIDLTSIPDLLYLDAVRLEGGTEVYNLDYVAPQDFRSDATRYRSSGIPRRWTVAGAGIRLDPTPASEYAITVDFSVMPPDLVDATDTDVVPRVYADLIAWAACLALGFRQREAWAMDYADRQYRAALRSAIHQDRLAQRQTSEQVRPYWSDRAGYGG
jgi:hypothetical protein